MIVKKLNMDKERMKFEAAAELGLAEKLLRTGWGGLTSEETGRIGALLSGKARVKNGGGNKP